MRIPPPLRVLMLALPLALGVSGCTTNPATGKSYFMLLSPEDEARLGEEAAPQFTQEYGGAVPDAALNAYVEGIGRTLAATTEADYPQIDWAFTFLDSDVVNAFALPGGKVFITRGLASRLESEAELAGVLGHEIGHVTAQHANRRISKTIGFNLAITGLAVAVGVSDSDSSLHEYGQYAVPALAVGGNIVLLKFGRDEELEADRLGMRYMSRAMYNPRGQLEVMHVLAELSGGARQPEFLSTHPHPESRIEQIERLLAREYTRETSDPQYVTGAERFQRDFLAPLAGLAPPAHRQPEAPAALAAPEGSLAAASWCGHCREEATKGRSD
jgi:predicted Zn-dependent protease